MGNKAALVLLNVIGIIVNLITTIYAIKHGVVPIFSMIGIGFGFVGLLFAVQIVEE